MRKICASVCLVAAVLAGGPAFAADASAVLRSSHLLPSDGPGDCGPLHDDKTVPPATTQSQGDGQGRGGQRGSMAGNYCASDSGAPARPAPQSHGNPTAPQAGHDGSAGSTASGPTGGMS
jgi:hypothetical protein